MSTAQPAPTEQNRRLRVFLCHASGDKPFVRNLYARLHADGFAPWLDEEDLLPGKRWQEEIPSAVRASDVVVVCLSQKSVSKEGYLQREIRYALDEEEEKPEGTIFIIPVRIEEIAVPTHLSKWQWADLFRNGGYEKLIAALNERAEALNISPNSSVDFLQEKAAAPTDTAKYLADPQWWLDLTQSARGPSPHRAQPENRPIPLPPSELSAPIKPRTGFSALLPKGRTRVEHLLLVCSSGMFFIREVAERYKNWLYGSSIVILVAIAIAAASVWPTAERMYKKGADYYFGRGVSRDFGAARYWYERAAAEGNTDGMNELGVMYARGEGVTQDYDQARRWFQTAADAGDSIAMKNLGIFYQNGWGVTQDYQQARQWYQQAADAGNSSAMNNLGVLYQYGLGVTQDYQQARQWYQTAANAGNSDATNNLGALYLGGFGVTQDYQQARFWYQKGADAGDAAAMRLLGYLYDMGQGVAQDYQQARSWYEKAANAGDSIAMYDLGSVYQSGRGVPQNYQQARYWYQKAADAGYEDAKKRLLELPK